MSYQRVSTTKTSSFGDGEGRFFIQASATRRTFCVDKEAAIDHAQNLIDQGDCEEFLIVEVVGVLRKAPTPVVYVSLRSDPEDFLYKD